MQDILGSGKYKVVQTFAVAQGIPRSLDYPGEKTVRVRFYRADGELMARVFGFQGFPQTVYPTGFSVDIYKKNGRVYVTNAGQLKQFPKAVPADTVAEIMGEVNDLIAKSTANGAPITSR